MPLYFAYGSNMDRAAMTKRCPASRPLMPARLARHRFVITCDGYASVVADPRSCTWGLLWELPLKDLPALDRYESLASGLYRKAVRLALTASGPKQALLYIGRTNMAGQPLAGYMEGIMAAAQDLRFPAGYMAYLATWLPRAEAVPRALARRLDATGSTLRR